MRQGRLSCVRVRAVPAGTDVADHHSSWPRLLRLSSQAQAVLWRRRAARPARARRTVARRLAVIGGAQTSPEPLQQPRHFAEAAAGPGAALSKYRPAARARMACRARNVIHDPGDAKRIMQ